MEKFEESDIIDVFSFWRWADINYHESYQGKWTLPPPGIVYCSLDHITEFFDLIEKTKTENKYTLVSGNTDRGLIGGKGFYTIGTYNMTAFQLREIPKNIKTWFLANKILYDDSIVGIPYGMGEKNKNLLLSVHPKPFSDRKFNVYVNWSDYTMERYKLRQHYEAHNHPWMTIRHNIPHKSFYEDLADSKFVLCTPGNGLDTYRVWESLYLGAIPIVKDCPTYRQWKLPFIYVRDFFSLNLEDIKSQYENLPRPFDYSECKFSYWTNKIRSAHDIT